MAHQLGFVPPPHTPPSRERLIMSFPKLSNTTLEACMEWKRAIDYRGGCLISTVLDPELRQACMESLPDGLRDEAEKTSPECNVIRWVTDRTGVDLAQEESQSILEGLKMGQDETSFAYTKRVQSNSRFAPHLDFPEVLEYAIKGVQDRYKDHTMFTADMSKLKMARSFSDFAYTLEDHLRDWEDEAPMREYMGHSMKRKMYGLSSDDEIPHGLDDDDEDDDDDDDDDFDESGNPRYGPAHYLARSLGKDFSGLGMHTPEGPTANKPSYTAQNKPPNKGNHRGGNQNAAKSTGTSGGSNASSSNYNRNATGPSAPNGPRNSGPKKRGNRKANNYTGPPAGDVPLTNP